MIAPWSETRKTETKVPGSSLGDALQPTLFGGGRTELGAAFAEGGVPFGSANCGTVTLAFVDETLRQHAVACWY